MSGFANVVGNLSPLPELVLWRDPVARSGEEAMAVDEALLEWGEKPVLRAYRWAEPTVTYGYFDEEATARAIFPGEELHFVRRWTGGGIGRWRPEKSPRRRSPSGEHPELPSSRRMG